MKHDANLIDLNEDNQNESKEVMSGENHTEKENAQSNHLEEGAGRSAVGPEHGVDRNQLKEVLETESEAGIAHTANGTMDTSSVDLAAEKEIDTAENHDAAGDRMSENAGAIIAEQTDEKKAAEIDAGKGGRKIPLVSKGIKKGSGLKLKKEGKNDKVASALGLLIRDMKINKKLSLLVIMFIICILLVSSFSFYAINKIKINGDLYLQIISGKDLIADINPPQAYLIESYALILDVANTRNHAYILELADKIKVLEEQFQAKHDYWSENLKEADVRRAFLENSYIPAKQFFEVAQKEYIPAALEGDTVKVQQLLTGKLRPNYEIHKRAIQTISSLVNDDNAQKEAAAAQTIQNSVLILMLVIGFGLAAIILIGLFIGRNISRPLKELKEVADKVSLGDVDVEIKAVSKDEIGDLMTSFEKMVDNIKIQAAAGERIANGDLSVAIEPRSEKDVLAHSMRSIVENLRALVNETQTLTEAAAEGNLNTRGNADAFEGGFKEIIEGVNSTLDGIVNPLNTALDYIEKIANGDELEELENNYKGQYAQLIGHLMMVRESIGLLTTETEKLTQAAFNGDFSYQPEIELHKGIYAEIMSSIDGSLANIIRPLRICGEYMKQIGNGEIPEKIQEEYKGEFNDIMSSINACIDGLGGLIEGRDVLVNMSVNDYTRQVEGSYLGIYAEMAESINSVSNTVRNVIRVVNNISNGELSDLDDLKAIGRRSENDTLMPSIIRLIENIQYVINEALLLTTAVKEGKLDTETDSGIFQGAWKNLVEGMNSILVEVAKPLRDVSEVMERIAGGDLQAVVQGSYQGEFDHLAMSVDQTAGMLNVIIGEITEVIGSIASGNLAQEKVRDYAGDFGNISGSLNVIIDSFNLILGDIYTSAEQVSSGSRQVSNGSQALSQGSTEQASSIEELKASIEDLAAQTKQNAVNANQASDLAAVAKISAEKGNGQMGQMLKSMEDINVSSANISKIIKVIDDIAFQTNILALNAAVEAARAGQHGKGFAVVAEEVRNLAARSAEAARSTSDLIGGSISNVETGIKIANNTASALSEIVTEIEKAAALVENIAQASNEQATGISQINKGIEQVSNVVQNNSATAEESAAASEELSGQAELLKEMVGRFSLRNDLLKTPDRQMQLESGSIRF